ncbi:MAG: hypothetical protein IID46_06225, partial [Planctomycetes bacterium]|nr:hypothetical protein [Planctomycetota bacterium]
MISKQIRFVSLISVILLALSAGVWWTVAYFNEAPPVNQDPPGYALLVFGPEAKTRLWVVARGQTLEIHRDGNLTGPAEYVEVDQNGSKDWKNIEIDDSDGKTRY